MLPTGHDGAHRSPDREWADVSGRRMLAQLVVYLGGSIVGLVAFLWLVARLR